MNNDLERLVPPQELCEKIPPNEFDGSVLAWMLFIPTAEYIVAPRSIPRPKEMILIAPAPTLAEILDELAICPELVEVDCMYQAGWHVDGDGVIDEYDLLNSTNAAMKLWLKLEAKRHE